MPRVLWAVSRASATSHRQGRSSEPTCYKRRVPWSASTLTHTLTLTLTLTSHPSPITLTPTLILTHLPQAESVLVP